MGTFIAWFISIIAKAFVSLITRRQALLEDFLGTGGMPSTHTSPAASLTVMTGLVEGFDSSYFAISSLLMIIIMYDASGVRRAAGRQARAINQLFKNLLENKQIQPAQLTELHELLGHEPIEVAGGAIIGVLTAFYIWSGGYFTPIAL